MFANFFKKAIKNKPTYMNATEIAKHFDISAQELNKIFEELNWAKKEERWWIATKIGISKGAEQKYNPRNKQKYIVWDNSIKKNYEIIQKVRDLKSDHEIGITPKRRIIQEPGIIREVGEVPKRYKKLTNKEKKEKGDLYEEYVASFFRDMGYYVWEHGKEKGMKDQSIDLFVKKERTIYFIQCKNWESWKIDHKEVKATRTDIRDFIVKNSELKFIVQDYQTKILYVTSKYCLTPGAKKYIEENEEILEYQVIPLI
jgi:hypothetical protein